MIHKFAGLGAVLLALAASLSGMTPSARAADGPKATPDAFEQNKRLGRGVNVIGYDPMWRNRSAARFKAEHFKKIKEAGFDSVRINLHPFRDAKADKEHRIDKAWFDTLDWAVEQALASRLVVILDFHEFTQMGEDPAGNRERFLAMWRQIAEHYQGAPSDVLFEVLNEPNKKLTPELWNGLLKEALAILRKSNPDRTVIVGPAFWNSVDYLDKLDLPDDRNLIVTVHFYKPMEFTHQGASWAGQPKTGVKWGTEAERRAVERDFDKVQAWAQKHNRPIYLGEFGAYDKGEMESRARYTSFVARQAEKRGWSWAYWQFDGDFIVYDIRNDRWVEPIRDALVERK
jgi:endoglucanase